jgi:DNA modification methylase
MTEYETFLESKTSYHGSFGIEVSKQKINRMLFPFQKDLTQWSIRKGRAAIFADSGLGKTFMQLEFARLVGKKTIIFAPLTVCKQTVNEAKKLKIDVKYIRSMDDIDSDISITNYEMIDHIKSEYFETVVLDESSILKSINSKTREKLIQAFARTPYRLCCTATPAPNDIAEIANHAEFLGILTREEMLATYFVHDQDGWRLRGWADNKFYKWLASWGMSICKPSDLGYADDGYDLPKLNIKPIFVESDYRPVDKLFFTGLSGIGDRAKVRKATIKLKVDVTAKMVNGSSDQAIIWCGLDAEQRMLEKEIEDAVSVYGSQSPEKKEELIEKFQSGEAKVLITKSSIAGFGMNFQNAHEMYFVGMSDSWEDYYQDIRREYRFGQKYEVNAYIILADIEDEIYSNVMRKEDEAKRMTEQLIANVKEFEKQEIGVSMNKSNGYVTKSEGGKLWRAWMGDSCEKLKEIEPDSIDLSVFSPPFASLYTYSASERDLGNSRNENEFFSHFQFIIKELFRVIKPGRVCAVHVADIPAMLVRDGYIGLKDFSGDVVKEFQKAGWVWDSRIPIDKNQQAQSIRTHSKALTMTQMKKDRSWLRPALPDYILKFRKPGENKVFVAGGMSGDEWIEIANPTWPNEDDRCAEWGAWATWYGIRESDTLQGWMSARGSKDERHICIAAGSLVLTHDGYIPVEDVQVGDMVLTHMGRWKPVIEKKCNGINDVIRITAHGVADLVCTPNHKLFTRLAKGSRPKEFSMQANPEWIEASQTLGSYLNLKLPPTKDSDLTEKECWIIGRWLGDGHRGVKRQGHGDAPIVISCSHDEAQDLINELGEFAGTSQSLTATQIVVKGLRKEVKQVITRCGNGASNKRLPVELLSLPVNKAKTLLDGYLSADGHYVEQYDRQTASSVSRALLLGMALIVQRVVGAVSSVYAGREAGETSIQGRNVKTKQDWIFSYRRTDGYKKSGWIDDQGAWKKVRRIEIADRQEVWDLQIADDESFTADGCIVHNCPLQLETIRRCVKLWTNRGETVLSPFAGIGSEGWVSIELERKFIGIELKPEYYDTMTKNLRKAESKLYEEDLFREEMLETA